MRRRVLLILAALFSLSVGALAISFRASPLPLSPLPVFKEPVPRGPDGMTIAAIRSGAMFSKAGFAFRGGDMGEDRTFAMGSILVRHPKGDLLIDAGFGKNIDAHVKGAPMLARALTKYAKSTPVVDQLAAAHIDARKLLGVVITHAHWDHTSGLDDLRGVPVLLPERELDFIRSGNSASELVRSFGELAYQVYGFSSGAYLGFEESHDVFGDGSVVLVAAGGHTPGSIIAFVTMPDGRRYAFVGDIVWQREGVEMPAERPWVSRRIADVDDARVREVVVRLHMLKERYPAMIIVPAHDSRVWDTLPTL